MKLVVVEAVLAAVGDGSVQRRIGGGARTLTQRRRSRSFAGRLRVFFAILKLLRQFSEAGGVLPLEHEDLVLRVDHLLVRDLRLGSKQIVR
jgi:hypothetical protein